MWTSLDQAYVLLNTFYCVLIKLYDYRCYCSSITFLKLQYSLSEVCKMYMSKFKAYYKQSVCMHQHLKYEILPILFITMCNAVHNFEKFKGIIFNFWYVYILFYVLTNILNGKHQIIDLNSWQNTVSKNLYLFILIKLVPIVPPLCCRLSHVYLN